MGGRYPSTIRRVPLSPLPAIPLSCGRYSTAPRSGEPRAQTTGLTSRGWAMCEVIALPSRAPAPLWARRARLFRVIEPGLEELTGLEATAGRDSWYTPWGDPPDTRSIADDGETLYANVHVGGIPRSRDLGATWAPTIDVGADVHQVFTAPDRVLAACARGLAVSEDGGDTWSIRTDGMHARYCRAGAVCGETVLVSASTGPSGSQSAVYRGGVGGGHLERSRNGLPEWFEQNIDSHCIDALSDGSLAAFASVDGRVFVSDDEGASWAEVASSIPRVRCLLLAN